MHVREAMHYRLPMVKQVCANCKYMQHRKSHIPLDFLPYSSVDSLDKLFCTYGGFEVEAVATCDEYESKSL